jgi:hypothetical protein
MKIVLPPSATYWLTSSLAFATTALFVVLTFRLVRGNLPAISRLLRKAADGIDKFYWWTGKVGKAAGKGLIQALRSLLTAALKWLRKRNR